MSENEIDVEGLRAVAGAAHYDGQHWYGEEEFVGRWPECCDCGCPVVMGANRKDEAAHIATFDPPTVLALLDELEALRGQVERVRAVLQAGDVRTLDDFREECLMADDVRAALADQSALDGPR